jgi:hypothetical protein
MTVIKNTLVNQLCNFQFRAKKHIGESIMQDQYVCVFFFWDDTPCSFSLFRSPHLQGRNIDFVLKVP